MANILLTGIITLDIINSVDQYPDENMEIRALEQQVRCGGNAHNTAHILRQYQHSCYLATTIADDASAALVTAQLDKQDIGYNADFITRGSHTPTSYICLNQQNGSRTIVHHRSLPELSMVQFSQLELTTFDWFHFEGRHIDQTLLMINYVKPFNRIISLEVEKARTGIEKLFPLSDIIFFSRPFAEAAGFSSAEDCLLHYANIYTDTILSCTWGSKGAWAIQHGKIFYCPAVNAGKIVDTLAAGDTYNAGMIHALINGLSIPHALQKSCQLAAKKCSQQGIDNLVI